MSQATALIDGNNFYASCEQSLDPALIGHPVVVLSNNDGCIVARSAAARALGIRMGTPYFRRGVFFAPGYVYIRVRGLLKK